MDTTLLNLLKITAGIFHGVKEQNSLSSPTSKIALERVGLGLCLILPARALVPLVSWNKLSHTTWLVPSPTRWP